MWTVNKIGDEGARMISESLKTNTTLTELNLSNDEYNENMKNEKKLWLLWTVNNIGESGTKMISESLKTNTTLTTLWLGGDEVEWNEMNIIR